MKKCFILLLEVFGRSDEKYRANRSNTITKKSTPVETHVVNAIDDIKRSGLALD